MIAVVLFLAVFGVFSTAGIGLFVAGCGWYVVAFRIAGGAWVLSLLAFFVVVIFECVRMSREKRRYERIGER